LQIDQLSEMFPGCFSREILKDLLKNLDSFDTVFSNLIEFVEANECYRTNNTDSDEE